VTEEEILAMTIRRFRSQYSSIKINSVRVFRNFEACVNGRMAGMGLAIAIRYEEVNDLSEKTYWPSQESCRTEQRSGRPHLRAPVSRRQTHSSSPGLTR